MGALAGTPVSLFELPDSALITIDIDPYTGLLWNSNCRGRQTVRMLRQLAPSSYCPPRPPPPPKIEAKPSPSPSEEPSPSPKEAKEDPSPTPVESPEPEQPPEPSPA